MKKTRGKINGREWRLLPYRKVVPGSSTAGSYYWLLDDYGEPIYETMCHSLTKLRELVTSGHCRKCGGEKGYWDHYHKEWVECGACQ